MATPLPLLARLLLLVAGLGCLAANTSSAEDQKGDDFGRKVVMTLFTRQNPESGQQLSVDDPSALKNSSFNSSVKTKIIVHGWLSDEKTRKRGGTLLKDALLEMFDYNVILVDWSGVDSINYISSRLHVKRIGKVVAQLVQQLVLTANMTLEDLHLIGHSLGAHIMGFAGRTIGLSQGRITALDPAGPLFWDSPSTRLDKSDAGFVDVIHTCGGYMGYKDPIGHADFYPNGGTWVQPGCGIDIGACSHCRGYSLLLESIESPGAFIATNCSSWSSFKAGKCSGSGTAEMGLGCSTQARGNFYLRTNSQPSYSKTSGKTPRVGADEYYDQHVHIYVYHKGNANDTKGAQINITLDRDDILKCGFSPDHPTKVLIHGFANDGTSEVIQLPKNAYLASGDVNVLAVDWSEVLMMPVYFVSVRNIMGASRRLAEVLDFMAVERLLNLDTLHIIGHSLGAHVAGVTAELMESGRVHRITGLDPAGPFIDFRTTSGRLSDDDAVLVDVIHTNAGYLGEQAAVGHLDFYPNGGRDQPGCSFDFIGTCAHGRSIFLWTESIENPKGFVAWKCDDVAQAQRKQCSRDNRTAIMGEHITFTEPGVYYLETNRTSPFRMM